MIHRILLTGWPRGYRCPARRASVYCTPPEAPRIGGVGSFQGLRRPALWRTPRFSDPAVRMNVPVNRRIAYDCLVLGRLLDRHARYRPHHAAVVAPAVFSLEEAADSIPVPYGTTVSVDRMLLTFIDVPQDSRCPARVVCVWAGDATVSAGVTLACTRSTPACEVQGFPIPSENRFLIKQQAFVFYPYSLE
jgi:hypothetical protein